MPPASSPSGRPAWLTLPWWRATEARTASGIFLLVLVLGCVLGAALPPAPGSLPDPWRTASGLIGWTYFAAWSISFWPQVFTNAARRSVVGLSFDYIAFNLLGFSCYTAYNAALFWNPTVRAQYAARYNGSMPSVQSNDVFFGVHAVLVTALIVVQVASYERGGQRVSRLAMVLLAGLITTVVVGAGLLASGAAAMTALDFVTLLSYVKLAITLLKYTPQAVLNWRRKSTLGWTVHNVLLDFTGGLLSVVQLVGDSTSTGDWSGVTGNVVKFALGFTSMVFDVVFMTQHYCLYAGKDVGALGDDAEGAAGRRDDDEEEAQGLAGGRRTEGVSLLKGGE